MPVYFSKNRVKYRANKIYNRATYIILHILKTNEKVYTELCKLHRFYTKSISIVLLHKENN